MNATKYWWLFMLLSVCAAMLIGIYMGIAEDVSDLQLRYNEVVCSHTGVNPFDVWSGKVSSPDFASYNPGMSRQEIGERRVVLAYPPWHTTFFWFYGWLSFNACNWIMTSFLCVCVLASFVLIGRRLEKPSRKLTMSMLVVWFLPVIVFCSSYSNYCALLLLLSLVLYDALEKSRHMVAAFAWALMMIKPQVAILFFWPILFQKRFLTIGAACAICLLATLWPAYVYGASPIELILQVPQIGAGYMQTGNIIEYKIGVLTGIPFLWSGVCFLLCGLLSWRMRCRPTWFERFAPVLFLIPLWTYGHGYDKIVQMPLLCSILCMMYERGATNLRVMLVRGFCITAIWCGLFISLWHSAYRCGVFSPIGFGWIYRIHEYAMQGYFLLLFAVLLFRNPNARQQSAPPG